MHLSVISPETFLPREVDTLHALFAAGLERYHVRKPGASASDLEVWLRRLPSAWRSQLILHSHHHIVDTLGLDGRHWGEHHSGAVSRAATVAAAVKPPESGMRPASPPVPLTSRACHDLPSLRRALGRCDVVLASPIFASISKPGYGPNRTLPSDELRSVLVNRTPIERQTQVFALGGVATERIPACRELGFDGIAVLGAIWQAPDPVAAFAALRDACAMFPLCPRAERDAPPLAGARNH